MKRLLLIPLLLTFTGCSSNLIIKNNVGEKILIKNSTIESQNFKKDDLIKLIDRRIKGIDSTVIFEQERAEWASNMIEEFNKYESKFYNDYRNKTFINIDKLKEERINILNYKFALLENNSDITHKISLSFTPIFIDLNNNKEVRKNKKIYCFNPILEKQYLDLWFDLSTESEKELLSSGLNFSEVCSKYAIFN